MKKQVPPSYSALHVDWERAYHLARKWKDFSLPTRDVSLRDIEIIRFEPPYFSIKVTISSGGYIRSLAQDIWEFFGMPGWYIRVLRREELISQWKTIAHLTNAQNIEAFDKDKALNVEDLFFHIERVNVTDEVGERINNGIVPYGFLQDKKYFIWQDIFIYKNNILFSLLRFWEDGLQIIKNNL